MSVIKPRGLYKVDDRTIPYQNSVINYSQFELFERSAFIVSRGLLPADFLLPAKGYE